MTATATRLLDNYIAGSWTPAQAATGVLDVTNPATGEVLARVPLSGAADLDAAVAAARAALPEWRAVSTIARARKLFDLRERLVARQEDLRASVTTEMGKTIADAAGRGGADDRDGRGACAIPTTMQGRILEDVSRNIDAETIRQPVGVCAAIVPFNFPAMVPFWFLPFAIACGNTFVLKPSEQVPLTQQIAFEELDALGLPAGVVNLVNGGREVVEGILDHPGIDAVSFVGSAPVARIVYERRGQGRQARAGARRRQEPHGRHARRGDRQDRRRDHRLGVRRRRPALHGRLGRGHRRRRARAADGPADRGDPGAARRRRPATTQSTSARSSRARRATGSGTGSTAASPTAPSWSSTAAAGRGRRSPTAPISARRSSTTSRPRWRSPRRRCSARCCA